MHLCTQLCYWSHCILILFTKNVIQIVVRIPIHCSSILMVWYGRVWSQNMMVMSIGPLSDYFQKQEKWDLKTNCRNLRFSFCIFSVLITVEIFNLFWIDYILSQKFNQIIKYVIYTFQGLKNTHAIFKSFLNQRQKKSCVIYVSHFRSCF